MNKVKESIHLHGKVCPYQAMKIISNIKKKDSLKVLKTVLYIRRMDLVNNPYKKIECDK